MVYVEDGEVITGSKNKAIDEINMAFSERFEVRNNREVKKFRFLIEEHEQGVKLHHGGLIRRKFKF